MEAQSLRCAAFRGGPTMSQDQPRNPEPPKPATPVEKDAGQEIGGRQPQRPGQNGKYQPRPGERDPETVPSADTDTARRS